MQGSSFVTFNLNVKDLGIVPNKVREERFMTIIKRNCDGDVFSLKDAGIGEEAMAVIARIIMTDRFYKTLVLAGNSIRDRGALAIAEVLKINTTLTSIDLRSNDIGLEGGVAMFKALSQNTNLEFLDLSGMSGINRNHIGLPGAEAIAQTLEANKVLEKLYIRENGFGPEGAKAIAEGFLSIIFFIYLFRSQKEFHFKIFGSWKQFYWI